MNEEKHFLSLENKDEVVQPNLQVNYLGHWESPNLGNHGTGLSFTFKLVASLSRRLQLMQVGSGAEAVRLDGSRTLACS